MTCDSFFRGRSRSRRDARRARGNAIGAERLEARVALSSVPFLSAPLPNLRNGTDSVVPPTVLAAGAAGLQAGARGAPRTFVPPAVGGVATISGNITRDTTFVAGPIYLITGEVHVWRGKTLTIEDGVEVRILNGRGQFATLTSRALIFDPGSSLVAQSVVFQAAANEKGDLANVADNGGVFFCGGTRRASKDNVSSAILGSPPRNPSPWSFQATTITAVRLGRRDPASGDGNGPSRDDIDAVSVVGVVETEWKISSVKIRHSGDDGFDLTRSNIRMQSVRVINPTEDGVNLTSSNLEVGKSLYVDMTDRERPWDREIFDFEVDNGSSQITIKRDAEVNLVGFWDNTPAELRIYLKADPADMPQPKPLVRALYTCTTKLTKGSAWIYSVSSTT